MKILLVLILSLSVLLASNAKDKMKDPATKLEKIRDIKGSIIIKSYQNIGSMHGKYNSTLKVELYEFNNKKSKNKTHGLNVVVETTDKYNNIASSFIDYEEIQSLIKGLEYIMKINTNPTKLKHYEAIYSTNGGLEITNFNMLNGAISVVIQVGRYTKKSIYFDPKNLNELKNIVSDGYEQIKALR